MTKGETLQLCVVDGEAVSVEFRFGGPEVRALAATKDGSEFSLAADTAAWVPGAYRWQAWGTFADGSKRIIQGGTVDLAAALSVGDTRTPARQIVEKIEAQMAGNAAEAVRKYKINNRELERYSVSELMQLLSYWRERMKREERAEKGVSALGPRIAVRF